MGDDKEIRLAFLSRAAFLRREMQGREHRKAYLRKSAERGGPPRRLIYIFDTNVIVSYCAPWIAGPRDVDGRNGSGVVFPADWAVGDGEGKLASRLDRNHATLVLKSLAEFALVDASDSKRQWQEQELENRPPPIRQPIFMFQAHYEEAAEIYKVVADKARNRGAPIGAREVSRREKQSSVNLLALLRSTKDGYDPNAQVSGRALSLVNYLIDRQQGARWGSAVREWDGYVRLSMRTGGIYSSVAAPSFLDGVVGNEKAFRVMSGDLTSAEVGLKSDLVSYWKRRLDKHKPGPYPQRKRIDAEALADLFLINMYLDDAQSNARIVLITADENLVRATYGGLILSRVSHEETRLRDLLLGGHGEMASEFSLRHVGHLWGNIGEALAGREAGQYPCAGLNDFFNGLLAKGAEATRFPPDITERIALFPSQYSDLAPSRESITTTLQDWADLSISGVRQSSLSELGGGDDLRRAILEIVYDDRGEQQSWDDLLALVQEQIDRKQDRLTINLSDTGIGPLVKAGLLGARNPPDLRFSSFKQTQHIFDELARGRYKSVEQFEHDLSLIETDCIIPKQQGQVDDRQLSYLKYLVLGAAFASADKWSVALEHALMAGAIPARVRPPVPKIPAFVDAGGVTKHIAGREAHFLAAVAQRIIADDFGDLDQAAFYLKMAERAVGPPQDHRQISHIIRFAGERLALSLARYYLDRYDHRDDRCEATYKAVVDRCGDVLHLSESHADSVNAGNVALVSIATNVIQTAVIEAYWSDRNGTRDHEQSAAYQSLQDCLKTIQALVALPETLRPSNYIRRDDRLVCSNLMAAYFFAGALLTCDVARFEFLATDLPMHECFPSLKKSKIAKYDDWRYRELYAFCSRRWEELKRH